MRLVVDANVLFSAFLRKGIARRIFLDRRLELYAPEYLLDEYKKYHPELVRRAGMDAETAKRVSVILLARIQFVSPGELIPYQKAAKHLTIDAKDEPYIACALAINADLWSHDRHLKQPRIKCWSVAELARELAIID